MTKAVLTKWEYKTLHLAVDEYNAGEGFFKWRLGQDLESDAEDRLSELGDEGWELISVMPIDPPGITSGTRNAVAFFKRATS